MSLILLALSSAPGACPFCAGGSSDFFTDLLDAQALCKAQRVAPSKYKILEVYKGKATVGRVVIAGDPPNGVPKDTKVLLLSTAGSPSAPYWSDSVIPLNATELAFVRKALTLKDASDAKLWDFAVEFMEGPSERVNEACYNILSAAPLEEVKKRGAKVGQDRLLSYIQNKAIPESRRALYVLMSLRGLTSADKDWLRAQLFSPPQEGYSAMVGPLILAHCQLSGAAGLEEIERIYLKPSLPTASVYQPLKALALAGQTLESKTLRSGIREVFRRQLAQPDRATMVLPALAVWKDYSAAQAAEKLAKERTDTWTRMAVVRYFRAFDTPEAKAALIRLKALDKRLVERTTRPYEAKDL